MSLVVSYNVRMTEFSQDVHFCYQLLLFLFAHLSVINFFAREDLHMNNVSRGRRSLLSATANFFVRTNLPIVLPANFSDDTKRTRSNNL